MKKSSLTPTIQNCNSFVQIIPSLRRLFIIFDSICPTIYRTHCSDSLRTLKELLCLIEEYLHITPPSTISCDELLDNEKFFEEFLAQLRRPSILRQRSFPSIKTDLYCFGQGIQADHALNQLSQSNVFCFELSIKHFSFPIQIHITDPDGNHLSNDIQYINTYNQGHTKLYSCSYIPTTKAGVYRISFLPMINREYSVVIHPLNNNDEEEEDSTGKSNQDVIGYSSKQKKLIRALDLNTTNSSNREKERKREEKSVRSSPRERERNDEYM